VGFLASTNFGNTFPYYATIARVDGLMFGSIIATGFQTGLKEQFSKDTRKLFLISLALVVACIVFRPDSVLWNNGAMLTVGISGLGLLSGALLMMALTGHENGFTRKLLRHPGLVFFGKYSYALYLFHWPVTSWLLSIFSPVSSTGFIYWLLFSSACFVITVLLALLSWTLLEQPILNLKRHFE
jgi:peptidoglycan/LPS O-acetylase OafA/YrhL